MRQRRGGDKREKERGRKRGDGALARMRKGYKEGKEVEGRNEGIWNAYDKDDREAGKQGGKG